MVNKILKGLSDEELASVCLLLEKASAEECVALSQRFNVQAQLLINRAEQRIQQIRLNDDD